MPCFATPIGQSSRMAATLLLLLVVPMLVRAQASAGAGSGTIKGTVHDSLGFPIAGAQVLVAGNPLQPVTDEHGRFTVLRAAPGSVSARVRRIGFRSDSSVLDVQAGKTTMLNVVLRPIDKQLPAVVVMGRPQLTQRVAEFYERRSHGGGRFFTHAEIVERNLSTLVDLFGSMGASVQSRRGSSTVTLQGNRCSPNVWLDGTLLSDRAFDLETFDPRVYEAIEVYNGPSTVPSQFRGSPLSSSACGTIVLWTQEAPLRMAPSKKGTISAAEATARMVDQNTVFTIDEVDVRAAPDKNEIVRPPYPDALYDRGVSGRVLAEFVVDTLGTIDMTTFSVVSATEPAFAEAVSRVIGAQRFAPAQRLGRSVKQVVHQRFEFVRDSTTHPKPDFWAR